MQLVDTHCHIQSIGEVSGGEKITRELWSKLPDFSVNQAIANAKQADVTRLIVVGCTLEDSKLAIHTVEDKENTWATIGIHPHEAKDHLNDETLSDFASLALSEKVVAIGECGLDYYYEHSGRDYQKEILEFQLALALEHNLPLIFHVREAYPDFWPIFDSYNSKDKPIKGVLHSFTDNQVNLEKALKHNLYIGVNGIATFNKEPNLTELYRQIPAANLVLETDSPFLTPAPIRGKINEPKNVRIVAEYLAGLRGEDLEQLAKATTANARMLFSIS